MPDTSQNMFLNGWLPGIFARTALPIVSIMIVNGLFAIVDAYFLGLYVGPEALSAVTLIFPCLMLFVALQTLVSNGMASVLARKLGAGDRRGAERTFTNAHILSLAVVLLVWGLYATFGARVIGAAAVGATAVAGHAESFMLVTVAFAPVGFFLSLNIDALRCDGRLGFMALVTIASSLLNIVFNWLLMGVFAWGTAGSAFGSVLAQALCLLVVLIYRWRDSSAIRFAFGGFAGEWRRILSLGAPMSLGFIGVSLSSAAVIYNLSIWQTDHYVATVGAYGIVTRVLTFAYLPLMGVSIAFQTICGNNYGAGLPARVARSLQIALLVALAYCSALEIAVLLSSGRLAMIFVDDPLVISETARILPWMVAAYFLFGQMMVLSGYFQSLGDAGRAALFGLSRPYLMTIPLTFLLPFVFGEPGIWMVTLIAEACMLLLAVSALSYNARRYGWRYGLLRA